MKPYSQLGDAEVEKLRYCEQFLELFGSNLHSKLLTATTSTPDLTAARTSFRKVVNQGAIREECLKMLRKRNYGDSHRAVISKSFAQI